MKQGAALAQMEVAHFSFDAAGIVLATAGVGATGGDFREQAGKPGRAFLRKK